MATNYLQTLRTNGGFFNGFPNSSEKKEEKLGEKQNENINRQQKRKIVNDDCPEVKVNNKDDTFGSKERDHPEDEEENNNSKLEFNDEKKFRMTLNSSIGYRTRFELQNKPVQNKKPTRSALI